MDNVYFRNIFPTNPISVLDPTSVVPIKGVMAVPP